MLNIEFTADELAKIGAADAARVGREATRNAEASAAYKQALANVGWDRSRLVVHEMPDGFGGAVVHKIPAFETWAMLDKRIMKALTSDGRKDDYAAAVAGLVENHTLLVHPTLSELQEWRDETPGLYGQIKSTLDARAEHGNYAGKSLSLSAKRDAPPKSSPD